MTDKEIVLQEIEYLTKELEKPIKAPVDRTIHNHQKAWLQFYQRKLKELTNN